MIVSYFYAYFLYFFFAISWLIFGVFSSSLLLQGVRDDFLFLQALVCFWDPSSSMASLDALIFVFCDRPLLLLLIFFFSSSSLASRCPNIFF